MRSPVLKTNIATSTPTSVTVRGRDLVNELMGKLTFTEMLYFLTTDKMPSAGQTKVLDACLVTLMEHGLTASVEPVRTDRWGTTYRALGPIRTPDGRNPEISAYWIIRTDDPRPQLTSVVPSQ